MNAPVASDAHEDAYATPIERIDVSNPFLYQDDTWRPYFERLRREDPVHWCETGMYGAFWSVTRYRDIMARHGMLRALKAMEKGETPPGISREHQLVRSAALVLPPDQLFPKEALVVQADKEHATV